MVMVMVTATAFAVVPVFVVVMSATAFAVVPVFVVVMSAAAFAVVFVLVVVMSATAFAVMLLLKLVKLGFEGMGMLHSRLNFFAAELVPFRGYDRCGGVTLADEFDRGSQLVRTCDVGVTEYDTRRAVYLVVEKLS